MSYCGWLLPNDERARLLAQFPPNYPDVIAHHITFGFDKIKPDGEVATIIGTADNEDGVQALVVVVNGKLLRPDGKVFHITWSIDRSKGYKPVDSNRIIFETGIVPIVPFDIKIIPQMEIS